jgi:cell division inhibitor SepF
MLGLLRRAKTWLFAYDGDGLEPAGSEEIPEPLPKRRGRLIPLHSRSGEIFIRRPRNQEEARICVDCLRARRAVIANLKDVETEQAVRVFDFLGGAVYALGGQLEQAGDSVYLITPQSIGIMAEEEAHVPARATSWQEI